LTFTSTPQNLAVSTASGTMTVELRDDYENPSNTGSDLSVSLTSSSGTGTFLDSTNATMTSQTMATGTHAIQFKYQDSAGGNPLLTSHASTIAHDGTQTESVAAKLAFTSSPQLIQTGSSSDTMTIQLEDGSGASVNAVASLAVNLTTGSATGAFRNTTDTGTITSVSIGASSSTASFKYRDSGAGAPTLTAQSTGHSLTNGTQTETVADQLNFTTTPQTLTAGTASGVITVELQDSAGAPVTAGFNITVQLQLPSTDVSGKFRDSANTMDITEVTITAGSSSADFLYQPNAPGNQTIKAVVGHGITDAEQTETVS
jgi:hypothetical protein